MEPRAGRMQQRTKAAEGDRVVRVVRPVYIQTLVCLGSHSGRIAVPVSISSSRLVYDAVKRCGVRLISALPETWLVHLIRMAEDDPEMTLVRLAREEEGVGISAGAHLAGVPSAMLMQNHGFLASINGIVSCAQLYRIPLLMVISHRVDFGERDPWQTEGGGVTEDLRSEERRVGKEGRCRRSPYH